MVSIVPCPLYCQKKGPQYTLERRLSRPQTLSRYDALYTNEAHEPECGQFYISISAEATPKGLENQTKDVWQWLH